MIHDLEIMNLEATLNTDMVEPASGCHITFLPGGSHSSNRPPLRHTRESIMFVLLKLCEFYNSGKLAF